MPSISARPQASRCSFSVLAAASTWRTDAQKPYRKPKPSRPMRGVGVWKLGAIRCWPRAASVVGMTWSCLPGSSRCLGIRPASKASGALITSADCTSSIARAVSPCWSTMALIRATRVRPRTIRGTDVGRIPAGTSGWRFETFTVGAGARDFT